MSLILKSAQFNDSILSSEEQKFYFEIEISGQKDSIKTQETAMQKEIDINQDISVSPKADLQIKVHLSRKETTEVIGQIGLTLQGANENEQKLKILNQKQEEICQLVYSVIISPNNDQQIQVEKKQKDAKNQDNQESEEKQNDSANDNNDNQQQQNTKLPQENETKQCQQIEQQQQNQQEEDHFIGKNEHLQGPSFVLDSIRAYLNKKIDNVSCVQYDTYCVIKVGEQMQKTDVHFNCDNRPEWNQQFVFSSENVKSIQFDLYDKKQQGEDRFIGSAEVEVEQFVHNKKHQSLFKGQKKELILGEQDLKKIINGNVYFDISYYSSENEKDQKKQKKQSSHISNQNKSKIKNNSSHQGMNEFSHPDHIHQEEQKPENLSILHHKSINDSRINNESSMISKNNYSTFSLNGTSHYQSAATLRNSIPSISFSRADRFNQISHRKNVSEQQSQTDRNYQVVKLPSLFDQKTVSGSYIKKGASFGLGNKIISPSYRLQNDRINPGPGQYFKSQIKFQFTPRSNNGIQKCTFGSSREDQSKIHMPESQLVNPRVLKEYPAPNQYQNPHSDFGKDKEKFSMQWKYKPTYDDSYYTPSPLHYAPKYCQLEISKYKNINFGYSDRRNYETVVSPGPANYNIPSSFDKFKHMSIPRLKTYA